MFVRIDNEIHEQYLTKFKDLKVLLNSTFLCLDITLLNYVD